ncbi:MAG: hypothetical protein ACRBB0_02365 [Pelagimonas sp.]
MKLLISIGLIACVTATFVQAAPSAQQTCKKMVSEGRAGGKTQQQCHCMYQVADQTLDEDIKALLFDAWYNGTNNMAALEKLPGRARVKKQLKRMQKASVKYCS